MKTLSGTKTQRCTEPATKVVDTFKANYFDWKNVQDAVLLNSRQVMEIEG